MKLIPHLSLWAEKGRLIKSRSCIGPYHWWYVLFDHIKVRYTSMFYHLWNWDIVISDFAIKTTIALTVPSSVVRGHFWDFVIMVVDWIWVAMVKYRTRGLWISHLLSILLAQSSRTTSFVWVQWAKHRIHDWCVIRLATLVNSRRSCSLLQLPTTAHGRISCHRGPWLPF